MGREEIEIIAPAIAELRRAGIDATGPWPADTLFHARARKGYDAVLCMYHDQALIPAKTLAFDDAVNVTLGLPFIRTSPDHGTAYDIAGKDIADEQGYILASPMEGLPAPVVASSWNHQILLQDANDDDLKRFIATYKQGPDTPEPGASCSGITNPEGV